MNKLSLFTGCGMDDLASTWAGIETVCMVERDPWCQRFLRAKFPRVPIIGDVHEVTKERVERLIADCYSGQRLQSANALRSGRNTVDFSRPEPCIDIIGAGPPCQPVSVAGQRRGKADDRWLWEETLRVVSEFQPTWCVAENPAGILSMAQPVGEPVLEGKTVSRTAESDLYKGVFSRQEELLLRGILEDFTSAGYERDVYCVPACGVGAFHQRYRVFIVAHAFDGRQPRIVGTQGDKGNPEATDSQFGGGSEVGYALFSGKEEGLVAHRTGARLEGQYTTGIEHDYARQPDGLSSLPDWAGGEWGMPEPLSRWSTVGDVRGVAARRTEGLDVDAARYDRVNRLKALGNGCVPQQVKVFYDAIMAAVTQQSEDSLE